MKKLLLIVTVSIILLSCGQTSQVSTSEPTLTPIIGVDTLTSTNTIIVPTNTPLKTNTPTATITSSPTSTQTPTLEPYLQTAIVKTQTQNAIAYAKTATVQEKKIRMTNTAQIRNQQRTSTQIVKNDMIATVVAAKTMIARYKTVDPKKLATYPQEFKGEYVRFDIKIFNFIDDTSLQGWIIGGYYDPIIITFTDPYHDIYEDEIITVFGVVQGKQQGTNSFGGGINQAWVADAWYRK